MNKRIIQQFVYAVSSYSTGIIIPVFNLILLEKGSDLKTLPILLSIYSLTVLSMELPSGVFADMYGRKAVFLLSCGFQTVSFFLLLAANNFVWLIFAVIFSGLGRAFSSGSLDALLIDQAISRNGEGYISKVTSRLAVLEGCGLALGAVTGGMLSDFSGTYTNNIALRMILTVALVILCILFINEQPLKASEGLEQRTSFAELLRQGKKMIFSYSKLAMVFMGVFFTGFLLFSVETYWQPAFVKTAPPGGNTWLLGIVSFIGFIAVIFGNAIARKLLERFGKDWWNLYYVCRFILAAGLLVFAFQRSIAGFLCTYAGIYLFLGTGNVVESTLINKHTPGNVRASILSLNSLVSQIGGLCSSLLSSIMIIKLQFRGVWMVAGVLMVIYVCAAATLVNKGKLAAVENSTDIIFHVD